MSLAVGPFKMHFIMYGLSAVAHFAVVRRWCGRMALPNRVALGLSACFVLGMALGARILYDLFNRHFYLAKYLHPGYYFSDGLWGGPLAYLVLATAFAWTVGSRVGTRRLDPRRWDCTSLTARIVDVMVLSLPIPLALAKVGCLFNGCCFGSPCGWPWGIVYPYRAAPPAGVARHPTQLYELVAFLFIYIVLVTLERRRWNGLLHVWFVLLYGLARPITEFFRVPAEPRTFIGFLTVSQALCLTGATLALIALWRVRPPRRAFEPPLIRTSFA